MTLPDNAEETTAAPPAWESLPVGDKADGHAVIITAEGSYIPSGARLTGPVDSIAKLDKFLRWVKLGPCGVVAQVWIVGIDAVAALGWEIDPGNEDDFTDIEKLREHAVESLENAITPTLEPLLAAGWEMRGKPGFVIRLSHTEGSTTKMVDLMLEPYSWTYWNRDFSWNNRIGGLSILGNPSEGTYLPDGDRPAARELARRLSLCIEHLGTLPGPTTTRTGAAVLDKIRKERKKSGKGIQVSEPGPVPPIDSPLGDSDTLSEFEPPYGWARALDWDDLGTMHDLVTIDQRASYLASAGMLDLGYGDCVNVIGDAVQEEARKDQLPFGIWLVTLPPTELYALPEKLPPPHPAMLPDRPVQTWVTTVTVEGLCAPIADGGMGLEIDDLGIIEAWLFDKQGRVLDKWAKLLREGRKAAVAAGDVPTKKFIGASYKGYVGRMKKSELWSSPNMRHHHQPLWRAAIMAHARFRGRRVAMRIARETGRWPFIAATDSWVYLLEEGQSIHDESQDLGKMDLEKHVTLTDEMIVAFCSTDETPRSVRLAVDWCYAQGKAAEQQEEEQ